MASRKVSKELKNYIALVEKYGLSVERGTKHYIVRKGDAHVATVSGSGEANALRQSIRDLRRDGHVDDAAARVKF